MSLNYIKKSWKLYIYIFLASLPTVMVIFLVFRGVSDRNDYKKFLENLDTVISFSIQREELRAEVDGVSTRLTEKNASSLYNFILDSGYYFYNDEIPESEKVILLEFASGEKLFLIAEDDKADMSLYILKFVDLDNKEYTCLTRTEFRFITFTRLVSVEFGNELWEAYDPSG